MSSLPGTARNPTIIEDHEVDDNRSSTVPLSKCSEVVIVEAQDADIDEDTTMDGYESDEEEDSDDEESEPTPGTYRVSIRPDGWHYIDGALPPEAFITEDQMSVDEESEDDSEDELHFLVQRYQ